MRNIFFCSLRNSLITMVLLAVLPALGVILNASLENRDRAIADAEADTQRTVLYLAREQQLITMRAEQQLSLLAQMPQVRSMDGPGTTSILRRLKARGSVFANIVAADAQGHIFAAAQNHGPLPRLKGASHFRQALETGEFSVGKFEPDPSGESRRSVIHFAYPIPGKDGQPVGVLVSSLRPERYERFFELADLPEGSVLSIADADGTRLYRHPAAENTSPPGGRLRMDMWEVVSGPVQTGATTVEQADGVRRIVGYTQLRLDPQAPPYMYLSVGIPERQALAGAVSALHRDLFLLAGAAALAILVAWIIGGVVIDRPVKRLSDVARRLAGGELDARSGPHEEFGELSLLAKTMDDMAETLSRDISARQDVEEELRKGEALLRTILEALPVGVWMVDPDGRILFANRTSRRFLRTAAVGERPGEQFAAWRPGSGESVPPEEFVLNRALEGEANLPAQVLEVEPARDFGRDSAREPGRLTLSVAALPVRDEEGQPRAFIVVLEDITERTQRERARESVEHILRHDLRSPLIGFTSLPQLLLREPNLTDEQRQWITRLHTSANGMLRIIDAYLRLSRIERGMLDLTPEQVDLAALAGSVFGELQEQPQLGGREARLTLEGRPLRPDEAVYVQGEATLCATMFANLFKNALEASPRGGVVEVDLRDLGAEVRIDVRNAGEVPASVRQRFFEKYATAGKTYGTGLGAYSARRIAEFHGGRVLLDVSQPGRTTVSVLLPKVPVRPAGSVERAEG